MTALLLTFNLACCPTTTTLIGEPMAHCDNCLEPANPRIHAVIHGTRVNVCSGHCIGTLYRVWDRATLRQRIQRRLRRVGIIIFRVDRRKRSS